jgi:hypothetical protein
MPVDLKASLDSIFEGKTQLDEKSLEDIAVAVANLRDSEGRVVRIAISDALQPWLVVQFPASIRDVR